MKMNIEPIRTSRCLLCIVAMLTGGTCKRHEHKP